MSERLPQHSRVFACMPEGLMPCSRWANAVHEPLGGVLWKAAMCPSGVCIARGCEVYCFQCHSWSFTPLSDIIHVTGIAHPGHLRCTCTHVCVGQA